MLIIVLINISITIVLDIHLWHFRFEPTTVKFELLIFWVLIESNLHHIHIETHLLLNLEPLVHIIQIPTFDIELLLSIHFRRLFLFLLSLNTLINIIINYLLDLFLNFLTFILLLNFTLLSSLVQFIFPQYLIKLVNIFLQLFGQLLMLGLIQIFIRWFGITMHPGLILLHLLLFLVNISYQRFKILMECLSLLLLLILLLFRLDRCYWFFIPGLLQQRYWIPFSFFMISYRQISFIVTL